MKVIPEFIVQHGLEQGESVRLFDFGGALK